MLLFVDSTVREDSRTRRLAERLVSRLADDDVRVLRLEDEHLRPFDARTLDRRTRAIEAGRWNSPLLAKAAEFASADQIVVAAPFWDLSFPALLKTYIEWISVIGVVFRYSDDGRPVGAFAAPAACSTSARPAAPRKPTRSGSATSRRWRRASGAFPTCAGSRRRGSTSSAPTSRRSCGLPKRQSTR